MDEVAPPRPTRSARSRFSASFATAYARFGTVDSAMVSAPSHIRSASDALLPPRLSVGRGCMLARLACLSPTVLASAARPSRPDHSHHSRPPHSPPLAPASHSPAPLPSSQTASLPRGADSDSSAPRLDECAATKTTARSPLPYVRQLRPTARTAAEFQHNLVGLQIAAGFERSQTAPRRPLLRPLFWRHLGASFLSYHR